jgi:hypothetical protein
MFNDINFEFEETDHLLSNLINVKNLNKDLLNKKAVYLKKKD